MTTDEKPGCAAIFHKLFGSDKPKTMPEVGDESLPYRLRDDFLSPAELSFFRVLQQAVGDSVTICTKVSLGDLFYPKSGNRSDNQIYRNKINRKHVDFLLCASDTMHPLVGIELDDASHQKTQRQQRDRFVEQVFSVAKLPLYRQQVQASYNTRTLATELGDLIGLRLTSAQGENTTAQKVLQETEPKNVDILLSDDVQIESKEPLCPKCEQPMVLRTVKKTGPHHGKQFWGCSNYPRCRGVREYK